MEWGSARATALKWGQVKGMASAWTRVSATIARFRRRPQRPRPCRPETSAGVAWPLPSSNAPYGIISRLRANLILRPPQVSRMVKSGGRIFKVTDPTCIRSGGCQSIGLAVKVAVRQKAAVRIGGAVRTQVRTKAYVRALRIAPGHGWTFRLPLRITIAGTVVFLGFLLAPVKCARLSTKVSPMQNSI